MKKLLHAPRCVRLALVTSLALLAGPAAADDRVNADGDKTMSVKIEAVVAGYRPNALHDTFEDGTFATYDATELRVIRPEKHAGKLVLFHNEPPAAESAWRAVGATVQFNVSLDLLQPKGTQIFSAAAEKLELLKPPGKEKAERADAEPRLRRQLPPAPAVERRSPPQPSPRERATLQRVKPDRAVTDRVACDGGDPSDT